tara:strand:- start:141 stop:356 length:216 start_codon:yes stop_codon:yes gene_type:complete
MQDNLTRRDAIAVMVMQAIIIKREVLRLSPEQAALSALEHADALLGMMEDQNKPAKRSANPLKTKGTLIRL